MEEAAGGVCTRGLGALVEATLSSTTAKLVEAGAAGVGIAGTARPLDLTGAATLILDVVVAGVDAEEEVGAEEDVGTILEFVVDALDLPGVRGGGARLGARLNESCAPTLVAIATGEFDELFAFVGRGALDDGGAAAGVGESEFGRCHVVSLVTE